MAPYNGQKRQRFDANGNLILDQTHNSLNTYTWDPEDRLVSFAIAGPFEQDSYDAAGMRVATIDTTGTLMSYIWDQQNLFGYTGATGAFGGRFTEFPGYWGGASSFGTAAASHFLVFDMSGNCRAYVNADGMTVTDTMTYRAFGEEIAGNVPNAKQSHYGAQFGYYHNTAGTSGVGTGRLYVRERWMDPTKSVWLSRDPLWERILRSGPVGRESVLLALWFDNSLEWRTRIREIRPYVQIYAQNRPVVLSDPRGLFNVGGGGPGGQEWACEAMAIDCYNAAICLKCSVGMVNAGVPGCQDCSGWEKRCASDANLCYGGMWNPPPPGPPSPPSGGSCTSGGFGTGNNKHGLRGGACSQNCGNTPG